MAAVSTSCKANCKPRGRISGFRKAAAHPRHTPRRRWSSRPAALLAGVRCGPLHRVLWHTPGALGLLMGQAPAFLLPRLPLSVRPAPGGSHRVSTWNPASITGSGPALQPHILRFPETLGRPLGPALILFIILFCVTTPCYLDSLFVVG